MHSKSVCKMDCLHSFLACFDCPCPSTLLDTWDLQCMGDDAEELQCLTLLATFFDFWELLKVRVSFVFFLWFCFLFVALLLFCLVLVGFVLCVFITLQLTTYARLQIIASGSTFALWPATIFTDRYCATAKSAMEKNSKNIRFLAICF